jgi:hypothetical protein
MDICRLEKERRMTLWLTEFGMDTDPLSIKPVHAQRFSGEEP